MSLGGLAAAAYATSAVLRLRAEETGGQAEPLLATATGRIRWGLSHVAVAVAGAAVLLAVAGVAAGLGYGLRTGSAGPEVARLLGAAMAQLPASLAVAGAAVVLFGLLPRASVAGAWTVVGVLVLIVAVTGCGADADRERAAAAGVHLYLVKPVDPAVLEELLAGTAVPAPR